MKGITRATDREIVINRVLTLLKEKNCTYEQLSRHLGLIYGDEAKYNVRIPLSLFRNTSLSALEIIVKYLHENEGMRFSDIAKRTNRDPRAIRITYLAAKTKAKPLFEKTHSRYELPIEAISNRKLSVLESIVIYLTDKHRLEISEIAAVLEREYSTIWTVYNRALKKMKK